jgi:hypothetical protein
MTSEFGSEMKALSLFGGLTAMDLFPTNNLVMIGWALLIFLPRWKWTPSLTLLSAILHSFIFMGTSLLTIMSKEPSPEVDFSSLQGIHTLMSDPTNAFAIWLHMVIFDFW